MAITESYASNVIALLSLSLPQLAEGQVQFSLSALAKDAKWHHVGLFSPNRQGEDRVSGCANGWEQIDMPVTRYNRDETWSATNQGTSITNIEQ